MRHMEENLLFDLFGSDQTPIICGSDEAGRGPLAGPVVAASCVLPHDFPFEILNDSKKLTEAKRISAEKIIKESAVYAVAFVSEAEIDEINILNASLKAMKLSFEEVLKKTHVDLLLVDGNKCPPVSFPVKAIVKGDEKIHEIMAASILAKCERDRFMEKMDLLYPGYDFASNKGYASKAHVEAIEKYGLTPIHRKTFHLKSKAEMTLDLF